MMVCFRVVVRAATLDLAVRIRARLNNLTAVIAMLFDSGVKGKDSLPVPRGPSL
jgi:hypothetical protein